MRRRVWFLVLGVFAAALGAASAYGAGTTATTATTTTTTATTTTTGTTTTTATVTTTGTSTTTPTPTYSRLPPSYLGTGCVGAGAAAIAVPRRSVLALGTPATSRGPSSYPAKAPIVRFLYSTAGGSACETAHVALGSVSLFGGALTATNIAATNGKGMASGVRIYGSPVALRADHPVRIGGWGEVTLQKTVGRLTAPLVVQLLAAHQSLPAGTTVALAFGASPQVVHKSKAKTASNGSPRQAKKANKKKHREPAKPPPDFPATPSPLAKGGGLTDTALENPVVSTAMRYLGVPYQWGGASPATGFDCSGLVKYVFARLGVPLVHYAAAQWHTPYGVWVAPNRLRPGDLVFFTGSDGTRKAPGHVGIYVADGYFIDAPHTGTFVRIDRLTEPKFANQYVGARKIDGRLIVARHLLHVNGPRFSVTPFHLGFPSPIGSLGESLGVAAPGFAEVRTPSRGFWIWVGVSSGGLLLLLAAGGLLVRRRQSPNAASSGETSN